jgi:hypothetical protein
LKAKVDSAAEEKSVKKFVAAVAVILCLITASLRAKAQDKPEENKGLNGNWHFVLDTPGGDREIEAEFTVDADGKVTGTFGKTSAAGSFKDGKMNLDFEMTAEETGETSHMKLLGTLNDKGVIEGNWQFSAYDGTFTAFRPKK